MTVYDVPFITVYMVGGKLILTTMKEIQVKKIHRHSMKNVRNNSIDGKA
jgi:hypothetical protein